MSLTERIYFIRINRFSEINLIIRLLFSIQQQRQRESKIEMSNFRSHFKYVQRKIVIQKK